MGAVQWWGGRFRAGSLHPTQHLRVKPQLPHEPLGKTPSDPPLGHPHSPGPGTTSVKKSLNRPHLGGGRQDGGEARRNRYARSLTCNCTFQGRAERDPLPTSRPRARPPGRATAAAAAAAARLQGIPPDLPLPLRLTLPCLAPVLDRRFPIYTTLGSSRLTLPSCSRWTLTSLELPPPAGPPPPPAPKDLGFLKHLPESLPLSGPGHTSLSLSPLRCLAPAPHPFLFPFLLVLLLCLSPLSAYFLQ